jgi:Flp pilus assembly pilin Flp
MSRAPSALTGTMRQVVSALRREEGQTLIEYALILMLIVLLAIVFLTSMGGAVSTMISKVADAV